MKLAETAAWAAWSDPANSAPGALLTREDLRARIVLTMGFALGVCALAWYLALAPRPDARWVWHGAAVGLIAAIGATYLPAIVWAMRHPEATGQSISRLFMEVPVFLPALVACGVLVTAGFRSRPRATGPPRLAGGRRADTRPPTNRRRPDRPHQARTRRR